MHFYAKVRTPFLGLYSFQKLKLILLRKKPSCRNNSANVYSIIKVPPKRTTNITVCKIESFGEPFTSSRKETTKTSWKNSGRRQLDGPLIFRGGGGRGEAASLSGLCRRGQQIGLLSYLIYPSQTQIIRSKDKIIPFLPYMNCWFYNESYSRCCTFTHTHTHPHTHCIAYFPSYTPNTPPPSPLSDPRHPFDRYHIIYHQKWQHSKL